MSERQSTITRDRSQGPAQASPPTDRTQPTIASQARAARRAEGLQDSPSPRNQSSWDGPTDGWNSTSNASQEQLSGFSANFGSKQHEKKWSTAYDALKNLRENSDLSSYSQEQLDKLDDYASDPDYGDDIASYTGKVKN